ncbi:WecB/TagA/CpsF family glycosyltransferase [Brachymonas wangyanguii]|uniref:WecB/TagA/CpsF family glycosyltransferase n=1 Tax=Brachymonas wangyanguii TaxID=3130163 RepID=UPI00307EC039
MSNAVVLGVKFHGLKLKELISELSGIIDGGRQAVLAFSNPEFLVVARDSAFLRNYLNSLDFNLADGVGVLWAAKLNGMPLPERVTGTDFTYAMADLSSRKNYGIYLLGGRPGVADDAKRNLMKKYPGCNIVGFHHGFFSREDDEEILTDINNSGANFLMVCLGNPRQEAWIADNISKIKVNVIFGNGGAMDFAAGRVRRAPVVFLTLGMEWLWRLFQDLTLSRVKRVFRLPKFVYLVLREKYIN